MAVIELLLFFYICGITGSLAASFLLGVPGDLRQLDAVLVRAVLWPLGIYHSYTNEIERQVARLHTQNLRHLVAELESRALIIERMAEDAVIQGERYQELLDKYHELKLGQKPKTYNGESVRSQEGESRNEPLQ